MFITKVPQQNFSTFELNFVFILYLFFGRKSVYLHEKDKSVFFITAELQKYLTL